MGSEEGQILQSEWYLGPNGWVLGPLGRRSTDLGFRVSRT